MWKIQCKLPPKTKRFCPLKTFNNAPLKSLDRWGYYYFSLFPSVCSHFTDTFSCQLNPVRRMYNTIHNGICYCRVSLEPFYKISQDIKYHVISYLSLSFINLNIS